jgi:GNAT superfamily N-acetyltransferase
MKLEVKRVESDEELESYHAIREQVLWNARGRAGSYDRHHPEEQKSGHYPLILLRDGEPLAVVRVDVEPPLAWFRLVAVREDEQRRGYGRYLLESAEQFAVAQGCTCLRSNVDHNAIGFYVRLGFQHRTRENSETSSPMEKHLGV